METRKQFFTKSQRTCIVSNHRGGYYALVKKGGKQFRRSLKTKDRKLAERRLKELKEKIGRLSVAEDAKLTFAEVAEDRWLESIKHSLAASTIEQREIRIRNLAPFFGTKAIRNLTAHDCEQWAIKRGQKLAPEAFVHELETLRAVLNYAVRHGLILSNPATSIRRPKTTRPKIVVPTREQFRRLVAAIRNSDANSESQAGGQRGGRPGGISGLLGCSGEREPFGALVGCEL